MDIDTYKTYLKGNESRNIYTGDPLHNLTELHTT